MSTNQQVQDIPCGIKRGEKVSKGVTTCNKNLIFITHTHAPPLSAIWWRTTEAPQDDGAVANGDGPVIIFALPKRNQLTTGN